jgi:hypothetical protein
LHKTAKQLAALAIAVVTVATLATLAQSKTGQRELRKIGVAAPPPAFTALAFVDPNQLPTTLHQQVQRLVVPFTIINHSARAASYRWQIVAAGPRQRMLGSGFIQVAGGQASIVSPQVELGCTDRTRVNVLLSTGTSIGFWAACVRRGPASAEHRGATAASSLDKRRTALERRTVRKQPIAHERRLSSERRRLRQRTAAARTGRRG